MTSTATMPPIPAGTSSQKSTGSSDSSTDSVSEWYSTHVPPVDMPTDLPFPERSSDTYKIALYYVKHRLTAGNVDIPPDVERHRLANDELPKAAQVMRDVADEYEGKFLEGTLPMFRAVVDEIFRDNNVNWGRIVSMFTLAGMLAAECVHAECPNLVLRIVDWVTSYCQSFRIREFLDRNDRWNGFVGEFPLHGAASSPATDDRLSRLMRSFGFNNNPQPSSVGSIIATWFSSPVVSA